MLLDWHCIYDGNGGVSVRVIVWCFLFVGWIGIGSAISREVFLGCGCLLPGTVWVRYTLFSRCALSDAEALCSICNTFHHLRRSENA